MPGFSVFVTLAAGALAWPAVRLSTAVLSVVLAVVLVAIALGMIVEPDLRGLEAVLAFLLAVSGGALLGRLLPPRALPMVALLCVASVFDVIWITWGGSAGEALGDYLNLTVRFGETSGTLGTFDVLLAAAIATHWQGRGSGIALAVLPSPLGMVLGNLFFVLAGADNLPLVPFITVGWLITETWYRWTAARSSSRT